ncbi:MAG: hypothetical protein WHS89_14425, partial [Acidimicrobiales bacterium]
GGGGVPLSASPNPVLAGQQVTVTGTGWRANKDYTVWFNGAEVGEVIADDNGTFTFVFTVPPGTADGSYLIELYRNNRLVADTTISVGAPPPPTSTSSTTTTIPTTCVVTGATASPNPVKRKTSNPKVLLSDLTIKVTTNGYSGCSSMYVYYAVAPNQNVYGTITSLANLGGGVYQGVIPATKHTDWTTGQKTFSVFLGGQVLWSGGSFTVTN